MFYILFNKKLFIVKLQLMLIILVAMFNNTA